MTVHPAGACTFLLIETSRALLLSGPTEPDPEDHGMNDNRDDIRTAGDITDGIADDALDGLTAAQRDTVVTLLARVSERSYRRGFQQGVTISGQRPEAIRADLVAWRYGVSTDDAPWADGARIETAADRLFGENRHLHRLGLKVPMAEAIAGGLRNDPNYVARG